MAEEQQLFEDFATWQAFGPTWLSRKGPGVRAISFDARGRPCMSDGDFVRARDFNAFPVMYFWPGQIPPTLADLILARNPPEIVPGHGEKAIFLITVMSHPRERKHARQDGTVFTRTDYRDTRSWGWYSELAEAEDALWRNLSDLHDTTYDIAVIEEMTEGVMPDTASERWYLFDHEAGGYRPTTKPEDLRQVSHFWLG